MIFGAIKSASVLGSVARTHSRGRESINSFGKFIGYESAVYAFEVPPGMLPVALIVPKVGGKARDFVIVPERRLVESIPSLSDLGYSKILDERFAYVDPDGMEIDLQAYDAATTPDEFRRVRFAMVRWSRNCREKFPSELACVARVAGRTGMAHGPREIIPAHPTVSELER